MQNITLNSPGLLKQQLSEQDWKRVKAIKISGFINKEDIEWLNELQEFNKGLYCIDLFDIKSSEVEDIPLIIERGINNLTIPEGIKSIKKRKLKCLSISMVNIPKTVFSIEKGAFSSCPELKIINVSEQNLKYKSINGILYSKDGLNLLFCPPQREGLLNIPEGTLRIANKAFGGCDKIKTIVLPQSIIKENTGSLIQDLTNKKTEVRWNLDQERYNLGESQYSNGGKSLIRHTPDLEDYKEGDPHFDLLKKNEYEVNVPNGVETIEDEAFANCFQMRSIKLPYTLNSIGSQVFTNCTHLQSIEIPEKVKEIREKAFCGCRSLGKICCWSQNPPKCAEQIIEDTHDKLLYVPKGSISKYRKAKGWKLFKNIREVESLTIIHIRMSNGEKNTITFSPSIIKSELKDYITDIWHNIAKISIEGKISDKDIDCLVMMTNEGSLSDIDLEKAIIPTLKKKAFADSDNLIAIIMPTELETIPDSSFIGCKRLKRISIGTKTKKISDFAFAECTNLRNIILGDNLQIIGRGALWNCKNLESVIIGENIQEIGEDCFRGCENLMRIDSHAIIPPLCYPDTFLKTAYQSIFLTFPASGHIRYLQDCIWSKFTKKTAENVLF